jgi:hypothetical protein
VTPQFGASLEVINYALRVVNYAPRVVNYAPRVVNYAHRVSIKPLELSIMLPENIYSTDITHDDCHMLIVMCL